MDQFAPFDRRSIPGDATVGGWAAADGWQLRRFDWPAPAGERRGSILFLGGRGDIFEKYLESFAHWRRAGWSVSSFDWRGQGGSGRLAADPNVGHASDFAPWIDDLAGFFAQWVAATPAPHVVITHSMGGHLVMRALAEGRIAPDAAVMTAPMLGLYSKPFPPRVAGLLARLMTRVGAPERPAWKSNERPSPPGGLSRQKLLTHDLDRYADELWWKEQKPALALGPPSWAWLATAYASTAALERPGRLEAIRTPILLIGASADRLVDPAAIVRAARRLPNAEIVMFGPESAHEILREADPVRNRTLALIDAFLDAQAPAR
ncbi:MAG: lysophospholipase [Sphingomonas sp. SCN 67-18]|uniref:alpha/beta fold hydrolase n=1 Tax=uncultured Sphingomonas sp. TaxID=158754 RepID=UPI00086CFB53|nr:alpha/beta hydrolase [Sphingomonas sp. SCN 67-18]ODU20231.1 MAG: lysophospholipase [Sphingomonas sp. SCN 67-18]